MALVKKEIDYSKIGKKSRRKGKNFQREVKKLISKYLDIPIQYLEEPIEWGGQPLGDVFVVGKFFERLPVFIEAKKRETFHLHQFFTNPEGNPPLRWWFKTNQELPKDDKDNLMLVFSKNYFPVLCMTPLEVYLNLTEGRTRFINTMLRFYHKDSDLTFVVVDFKGFLLERRALLGLDA